MIEESGPGNLLLVTTAQSVMPLSGNVPPTLTIDDVTHLHPLQDLEQSSIGNSPCSHFFQRVWVDDLIA
jgi:hypothetical protein